MSSPSAPNGPVFAAPHVAPPAGTLLAPPPAARRGRPLGTWALLLSLIAGVLASAVAGFVAFRIARGAGPGLQGASPSTIDVRVLSPVRDLVLVGEITFWTATVVGIAAVVTGIIAVVRGSGRGAGIAAIVVGAIGPVIFALFVALAVVGGVATSPGGTSVSV